MNSNTSDRPPCLSDRLREQGQTLARSVCRNVGNGNREDARASLRAAPFDVAMIACGFLLEFVPSEGPTLAKFLRSFANF